jgi:hypothetical protein
MGDTPAFVPDAADHRGSTFRRQPRMLVDVHPGAPVGVGWLRNPSLKPPPRMNDLHRFDS